MGLAYAGGEPRAEDGIWAECVEEVVANLGFLRRAHVQQARLRRGCARNNSGVKSRRGQRLRLCHHRQGCEIREEQQKEQNVALKGSFRMRAARYVALHLTLTRDAMGL
jgi:hypothetical protein